MKKDHKKTVKSQAKEEKETNSQTILLVDDEEGIRKVLSISLADSGYKVITADNGSDAFKIFQDQSPPIVLTDIKMPGMTGIELLGKIKKINSETEVIMISGHGDMDLAIESLKNDATDFVTKPISDDNLEIALRRANDRIFMRKQLRQYTENLEALVKEKSAQLVKAERVAAISRAFEGLSSAIWDLAGDLGGGVRHFDEMPCLVSLHNPGLKLVAANKLFKERIGDKTGKHSWDFYKGEANNPDTCPAAKTFKSGKGLRTKAVIQYANGIDAPVIVHTMPIRNTNGDIELVLEISADVVEMQSLQSKLQASQQSYQNLFDAVPCYITVQDRDFKLTAINHLFKQDFDPTLGSFCYQVYKNLEAPCKDCPVVKTFEDGKSHQSEMLVTSKTGETINLLISTAPIMDNGGEITRVMELATNITQIRQLEDHLSSIGLKIGTIAHGIKGILTGLDGGMYLLDSGFTKDNVDKMKEGWDIVKLMVGRIRSLALDILYYAKERDLKWEKVDVIRFAQGVASAIEPKMKSHQIKFVCDFDPAIGGIEIDTSVVRTALINILENAIDACVAKETDEPKIISFNTKKDKNHIVFDVIDNGVGMDEETRKNIFTLFYSSKGIEGTGLGLFISKNIIQQHGGTINVVSQKDKGAHFCIRLPDTPVNTKEKKK
jgi:signal transduction histidine kinase/FixJ family two-component response regulator